MARPLSQDKRSAILAAAAQIVAAEGVEAATSRIAKTAGLAVGTLFIYFPTKDVLLNELYLTLKRSVADAVLMPNAGDSQVSEKLKTVWTNYIRWGLTHDVERRAMLQLSVSGRLTAETRAAGMRPFGEVDAILQQLIQARFEGSVAFASSIMSALAEAAVQFTITHPHQAETTLAHGFDALLRALSSAR